MDPKSLIRDGDKVKETLLEQDDCLMTKTGCKIYVPVRFASRKLASIGAVIRTTAIYAMVIEDKYYATSVACAQMQLKPSSMSIVMIGEDEYYEFGFDAGSVICPNVNLLREDMLLYYIYDEIVAKGRVPWFFNYKDFGNLFSTAEYHTGKRLAPSNVIFEMIMASLTRDPADRTRYYRHQIKDLNDKSNPDPAFIELRSVVYGPTNTTAKILGSYFDDNMLSALLNPGEKVEGVEGLLRM